MNRRITLAFALLLAGCPIGNDRYPKPADLSPAWRIDKLRVLAVRAEPPEVRPGETVRFTALVLDPNGVAGGTLWLACPPGDDDGVGFGCGLTGDLDFENATPDELAEAGFIGFEPGLPPRWTPDPTILDDLDPDAQREGLYQLVQLAVLPSSLLDDGFGAGVFDGDLDFNEVEVGYKRVVVSVADTPNRNPEVGGFSVDGWPVGPDTVVEVDPEQRYDIGLFLPDDTLERYAFTRADGSIEVRREQPYVTWYTDGGTMLESATLFPFLDARWAAPAADAEVTEGTWWAVVRDRRGGMAWASRRWRLRP